MNPSPPALTVLLSALSLLLARSSCTIQPVVLIPSRAQGPCNTLPLGPPVQPSEVFGMAPMPAGGSLTPGTYELQAFDLYGGSTSADPWPLRTITLQLTGDTIQAVSLRGDDAPERATWRVHVDGTTLALETRCGDWRPAVEGFDASADGLKLYVPLDPGPDAGLLQRRGVWVLTRKGP